MCYASASIFSPFACDSSRRLDYLRIDMCHFPLFDNKTHYPDYLGLPTHLRGLYIALSNKLKGITKINMGLVDVVFPTDAHIMLPWRVYQ
jgi:hypothetical protein